MADKKYELECTGRVLFECNFCDGAETVWIEKPILEARREILKRTRIENLEQAIKRIVNDYEACKLPVPLSISRSISDAASIIQEAG